MQGLCGELRLADFDELELSNLNRVPATVFDLGVNKADRRRPPDRRDRPLSRRSTSATAGSTSDTVGEFLDGLDVVVEECDSLDVKALVREAARARGIPVLMATSDRGLLDVERFDLEPERPIFHGLLGDLDAAPLAGLDNRDKIPHVLRISTRASCRHAAAASLVEVGQTLATWPQLAADVRLGAAAVAEAVRRIGLGEPLSSGRVRVDLGAALDDLTDPPLSRHRATALRRRRSTETHTEPRDPIDAIVVAASRAPSGGNVQPWRIESTPDAVDHPAGSRVHVDDGRRVCAAARWRSARRCSTRGSPRPPHGLGPVDDHRAPPTAALRAVLRL